MASQEAQVESSPPFVAVPGLPNMRDIGGLPVTTAPSSESGGGQKPGARKIIRRGVVFRSSEPSKLTDKGVSMLTKDLGITHVYDLRSKVEIDRAHGKPLETDWQPREWSGSKRVFVPIFLDDDYSPEALAVRFQQYSHRATEVGSAIRPPPLFASRLSCRHLSLHSFPF